MLKKGDFLYACITIYSKNDYIFKFYSKNHYILKMPEKVLFEFYSKIIYIFDDDWKNNGNKRSKGIVNTQFLWGFMHIKRCYLIKKTTKIIKMRKTAWKI